MNQRSSSLNLSAAPTKNDPGGDSAAHQKVEADIPGYTVVTKINWNKMLAVDIERPCNLWDEYLEETVYESETDLTAVARTQRLAREVSLWPRSHT